MRRSELVSVADLGVGANKREIFATIFGGHHFLNPGSMCLPPVLFVPLHFCSQKKELISSFPNSNTIFVLKFSFTFVISV